MSFLDWLGVTAAGKPLEVGDAAPEVVSRDEQGRNVRLADLYREGLVLVYFYPKADTPGCTAEACSLRDDFAALSDWGVRVVGVSADGPAAQMRFKEKHRLPFMLLADHDRVVARAFGVRLMLGMPHRQSFLIRDGRVVWRDLHASTGEQARDVLKALAEGQGAESGLK
jgi:peroxiredoxin Q/BCP